MDGEKGETEEGGVRKTLSNEVEKMGGQALPKCEWGGFPRHMKLRGLERDPGRL